MQRFALLGAGFIGSVHAANLAAHPDVDFVSVYDIDPGRAGALAGAYGAAVATDLAQAFDRDAIDAVFIASSTNTHAEHLRRAADAGVAALCEKPIDLDLGRAVDVVQYAAERSALDLARWIVDLDPVEVFATGSTLAEPRLAAYGDVDTSAVTLRLPTGALVQIDSAVPGAPR